MPKAFETAFRRNIQLVTKTVITGNFVVKKYCSAYTNDSISFSQFLRKDFCRIQGKWGTNEEKDVSG